MDWTKTIYLSPDAPDILTDFDLSTNFIIGGLIDRTVVKNASLSQANRQEIVAKRFALDEYFPGIIK